MTFRALKFYWLFVVQSEAKNYSHIEQIEMIIYDELKKIKSCGLKTPELIISIVLFQLSKWQIEKS